jgi:hypothetical protein
MSSYPPPGAPPPEPPPGAPQPPPATAAGPAAPARGPGLVLTVVGVLLLLAITIVGTMVVSGTPSVASLETGDCLSSADLAGAEADVGQFDVVDCGSPHDAEVLAVVELTGEAAEGYTGEAGAEACAQAVPSTAELAEQGVEVRPLTKDGDLTAGDPVVCLARRVDGVRLTGRLGPA